MNVEDILRIHDGMSRTGGVTRGPNTGPRDSSQSEREFRASLCHVTKFQHGPQISPKPTFFTHIVFGDVYSARGWRVFSRQRMLINGSHDTYLLSQIGCQGQAVSILMYVFSRKCFVISPYISSNSVELNCYNGNGTEIEGTIFLRVCIPNSSARAQRKAQTAKQPERVETGVDKYF